MTENPYEDAQLSPSRCLHEWVPERWQLEVRVILINCSIRLGEVFLTQEADGTLLCRIEEGDLPF